MRESRCRYLNECLSLRAPASNCRQRFRLEVSDYEFIRLGNTTPSFSALSIHHLTIKQIASLFGRIYGALNVAGVRQRQQFRC